MMDEFLVGKGVKPELIKQMNEEKVSIILLVRKPAAAWFSLIALYVLKVCSYVREQRKLPDVQYGMCLW